MIVISVSLVAIGLLVLELGSNYHFSGDIMAKQELTSMTPKHGYAVVVFDYTQPVGAKIQLLGAASNFDDAVQLKNQYTPNYKGLKGQVLIFDTSVVNNTDSVSLAEVYAMTPNAGYEIVSFNDAMPIGARLSPQTLDSSLAVATNDSARYSTANVDKQVQILTFTSSFDDNLKQILGQSYTTTLESANINHIKLTPPKLILPLAPAPVVQNTTSVAAPINATGVNQTQSVITINPNVSNVKINDTTSIQVSNVTSTNSTNSHQKSISVSDSVGIKTK
jgi:hypothetical protein